jgi:hypothetical protein
MLRWTLPIVRSIPSCRFVKIECDERGCRVNSKDPKQIESPKAEEGEAGEDDAEEDVAGMIGIADVVP